MMKAATVLFLAVTALFQTVTAQAAFTATDIAVMQFAFNLCEQRNIGYIYNANYSPLSSVQKQGGYYSTIATSLAGVVLAHSTSDVCGLIVFIIVSWLNKHI